MTKQASAYFIGGPMDLTKVPFVGLPRARYFVHVWDGKVLHTEPTIPLRNEISTVAYTLRYDVYEGGIRTCIYMVDL